jgi:hypothetical protein
MSHKSGGVIINRVSSTESDVVRSAEVHLEFPSGTSLEDRIKKVRQVERLLDKLDHDEED